jgi:hypothetical protein
MAYSPEATTILLESAGRGLKLWVEDKRICYKPKAAMTAALAASLKRHEVEVLALLNAGRCPSIPLGAGEMSPATPARPLQRGSRPAEQGAIAFAGYQQQTAGMDYDQVSEWIIDQTDPPINQGSDPLIPVGWSRPAWVRELRRMADCCEALRPDLAAEYREQAASIPLTHKLGGTEREPDRYPRPGGGTETFVERSERCLRECGGLPPGATRPVEEEELPPF